MLGWEAVGARMVANALKAKGVRLADQLAEEAVAARKWSDALSRRLVDTHEDESFELTLVRVKDPQRRVLGAGQVAACIQDVPKDRLEVQLGDERAAHIQQSLELLGPQASCLGWRVPVDDLVATLDPNTERRSISVAATGAYPGAGADAG